VLVQQITSVTNLQCPHDGTSIEEPQVPDWHVSLVHSFVFEFVPETSQSLCFCHLKVCCSLILSEIHSPEHFSSIQNFWHYGNIWMHTAHQNRIFRPQKSLIHLLSFIPENLPLFFCLKSSGTKSDALEFISSESFWASSNCPAFFMSLISAR